MRAVDDPTEPSTGVWCIVVAGGSGRRYGGAKQFEQLAGERVIDRSVSLARRAAEGVVAVVPTGSEPAEHDVPGADVVVTGGASRSESVRCGLAAVPADARVVLVHDAARPLASSELFVRVRDAVLAGAVAVVPAVVPTDTIRHVEGGVVDRDLLRAVQTPQGFDAATLRRVHADAPDATDDAGLVERSGGEVTLVPGERENLKITDPSDLVVAAALLDARQAVAS